MTLYTICDSLHKFVTDYTICDSFIQICDSLHKSVIALYKFVTVYTNLRQFTQSVTVYIFCDSSLTVYTNMDTLYNNLMVITQSFLSTLIYHMHVYFIQALPLY